MALLMAMAIPVMAQDGSEGDTVTKTFELTLNGEVTADQLFTLLYTPVRDGGAAGGTEQVIFCGVPDPQPDEVVVSDEDCVGGGNTYTYSAEFPVGTVLSVQWFRIGPDTGPREVVRATEETLDADMTNTVEYTFGAGDDQQAPDNQQDGEDKDTDTGAGDDQQAETPEEMPETGAGGLAPGASVPWGTMGLAVSGLLAVGYAVIRRR